jgi:hypothetical protein
MAQESVMGNSTEGKGKNQFLRLSFALLQISLQFLYKSIGLDKVSRLVEFWNICWRKSK